VFSRVLTQVTHTKLFLIPTQEQYTLVSCQLLRLPLIFSLPQHTLSPLPYLSLTHFNSRCGFLEYIFGLINSWCSTSQLLLALIQTTTNC
ncbi:unnamed protein product, partial [Hymenolepis diminuta]